MSQRCKALVSDKVQPRIVYVGETEAFVVDTENQLCLGRVPLESDTDHRVTLGPAPGTCVVGSWKKPLRAWNYLEAKLLWTANFTHFTHIAPFGSEQVKLYQGKSIILDAVNGALLATFPAMDAYKHPKYQIMVSERKISVDNTEMGRSGTFNWDTFAILDHAWSENVFVASNPTGEIRAYSAGELSTLMEQPRGPWFNVTNLCFNVDAHAFFGIATDWQDKPSNAIIKISQDFQRVDLIREIPNLWNLCFFDNGRFLLLEDGSVFRVTNGELAGKLEWETLLK